MSAKSLRIAIVQIHNIKRSKQTEATLNAWLTIMQQVNCILYVYLCKHVTGLTAQLVHLTHHCHGGSQQKICHRGGHDSCLFCSVEKHFEIMLFVGASLCLSCLIYRSIISWLYIQSGLLGNVPMQTGSWVITFDLLPYCIFIFTGKIYWGTPTYILLIPNSYSRFSAATNRTCRSHGMLCCDCKQQMYSVHAQNSHISTGSEDAAHLYRSMCMTLAIIKQYSLNN